MAQRRTLCLTPAQRAELLQARDHDLRPYVRERAGALLKIADGLSPHAVATQGLLRPRDPDSLYSWLAIYQTAGLPGLIAQRHGGSKRRRL